MDKEKEIIPENILNGFNTANGWDSILLFVLLSEVLDGFGTKHEIEKLKIDQAEMKGKLDVIEKLITK